jgi:hypothetical protein
MTTPLPLDSDPLRPRRQLAEELLFGNSQLRDNLTDPQAQQLLDWALDYVLDVVGQTAVLPDPEADAAIDKAAMAVARIMRHVDRLVAELPSLDDKSARKKLKALLTDRERLTGQPPNPQLLEQLVYSRQAWDNETTFKQLFNVIAWEQEEE